MFVLRLQQMRSHALLLVTAALVFASCGAGSDRGDLQTDWQHVLSRKKAAAAPTASTREKQIYADTLGAFVAKHPTHSRARAVYQRIQLDFASELVSLGRYQNAVHVYRSLLSNEPDNEEALRGLSAALDRLAVTRQKLAALEKGMSQRQVAQILGKPVPGWNVRNKRDDSVNESWYYRTVDGGIAGVYFRDGVVFAAEASSNDKIVPMTR